MAAQKVLVIERNPKIGGLIAGQLSQKGYEAEDVRHGAEAAMALRDQILDQQEEITEQVEAILGGSK